MRAEMIKSSAGKPFDAFIDSPLKSSPGELQCILLGTGNPMSGRLRERPSNLVLAGEERVLVDCGSGTARQLVMAGIYPSQINHLFFTHHHADHNAGFLDFFHTGSFSREVSRRKEPLHVYGPADTADIIEGMRATLRKDLESRNAFKDPGNQLIFHQADEGIIFKQEGLEARIFTVDHGSIGPAAGFRFEFNGKTVVFSGDTAPCENLLKNARGADILIHESYSSKWIKKSGDIYGRDVEKSLEQAKPKHTSTLEAAEIARKSGAGHLVLTHHIPSILPLPELEKDYITGMEKIYNGNITMGRDLMVIS
jgi:ribonuclease Z